MNAQASELYILELLARLGDVQLVHAAVRGAPRRHIDVLFRMPGWDIHRVVGSGPDLATAVRAVDLDLIHRTTEQAIRALRLGRHGGL